MIDKKFKIDTLVSYAGQAGVIASGFAFTTLVTKFSGIGVFGMIGLLSALSSVLTNLLTFRTNEAIVVFYKRGESSGDLGICKFALLAGIVLDIVVGGLLLMLVYWAAEPIAGNMLKDLGSAEAVRLFAFSLFFQFFRGAPIGYLIAHERFLVVNAINLSEHLIKLGLITVLLWQGQVLTLADIVNAGLVAAMTASLTVYGYLCWSLLGRYRRIKLTLNRSLIREYLGFSVNTFLSTALKAGNQNIDTLVLGWVADNRLVGIYALFRQFLAPLAFLSNPFSAIAYPKFVKAALEHRIDDVRILIKKINVKLIKLYFAFWVVIVLVLVVYEDWIRLGLEWSDYGVFLIMTFSAIFSNLVWWGRPLANAVEPSFSLRMNLFASVFIMVFIYPSVSFGSVMGVSLVMLVNNVALNIFWTRKLAKM